MQKRFTIPYINKDVIWNHRARTYIVGGNGTGKTLLMQTMMAWCEENGYNYNHYDASTSLTEAKYLIAHATDNDIIYACKMMSSLSIDFRDDIFGWAQAKNNHSLENIGEYTKDAELLREVLGMCGAGYSRMFTMTIKAIMNSTADYYFLDMPETSMHIHLAKCLVSYLLKKFPYMKIIITTHSPDIVQDLWNDDGSRNYTDIIELPTGYMDIEDSRKFNERF